MNLTAFHRNQPKKSLFILPSGRAHCLTCRQIFRDNGTFQMHQKQGACQRFFCRVEDHEHQQVDETFETLAAAKVWIVQQQLDQAYVITSSFGDRKAYRCRFRGKPKSKPNCGSDSTGDLARERMVPPVVPALGCLSKILVDRMILCQCSPEEAEKNPVVCQNWASMIRVRGCLTHSHEMENQFLRMSRVCQDYLVSLLRTGMDKRSILKMYLNSDFAQGKGEFKCITAQDLRNLEKKYIKPNRSQNSDCADDEGESDAMVEGRDRARKDTEKVSTDLLA